VEASGFAGKPIICFLHREWHRPIALDIRHLPAYAHVE
jgi:hypothetical protein